MGQSTPEHRHCGKGPERTRQTAKRRCAAGSGCSTCLGFVAVGEGRQRTTNRQCSPTHCPGHTQYWPPLSARRIGSGAVRKTKAWGSRSARRQPETKSLIAMVCSSPPEGRARWTVRLVAEEAVKRK